MVSEGLLCMEDADIIKCNCSQAAPCLGGQQTGKKARTQAEPGADHSGVSEKGVEEQVSLVNFVLRTNGPPQPALHKG